MGMRGLPALSCLETASALTPNLVYGRKQPEFPRSLLLILASTVVHSLPMRHRKALFARMNRGNRQIAANNANLNRWVELRLSVPRFVSDGISINSLLRWYHPLETK